MGGSSSKSYDSSTNTTNNTPQPAPAPSPSVPQPAPAPTHIVPQPAPAPKPFIPQPAPAPKPFIPQPAPAPKPFIPQPNLPKRTATSQQPQTAQSAVVSVTHSINDYIVSRTVPEAPAIPLLTDVHPSERCDRHNLRVCLTYNSKRAICFNKCHRFHVCAGWIIGKCDGTDCSLEHGFDSAHNLEMARLVTSFRFSQDDLKEQLQKNIDFSKRSRSKRLDSTYICSFFLSSTCSRDNCRDIHLKEKFVWQVKDETWVRFSKKESDFIEKHFCDPENDKVSLRVNGEGLKGNQYHHLKQLIGSEGKVSIDFEIMTATISGSSKQYSVRRLSTPSDIFNYHNSNTRWLWYEKNLYTNSWEFIRHGKAEKFYQLSLSDYLEKIYHLNESSLDTVEFTYDFLQMKKTRKNNYENESVSLRRRPALMVSNKPEEIKEVKFKDAWSSVPSNEIYTTETLATDSQEYQMVAKAMLASTSPTIIKIERVQNPYLWKKYEMKKRRMLLDVAGDVSRLNEQYLFHGTKADVLDLIFQDNLDWRLYGSNVGCVYGKGTYFANTATISDGYSSGHVKVILLVMVLVGDACIGNSSMDLPPENPATKRPFDCSVNSRVHPSIFVKYEKDEYYPAYAVHYRWN